MSEVAESIVVSGLLIEARELVRGNAHSHYVIHELGGQVVGDFRFQQIPKGPGLTNEVLLEIVAHRLKGFQNGPYSCRENALALTKIQEAILWLKERTRDRRERGVEGTYED